jgi:hypothetical protein
MMSWPWGRMSIGNTRSNRSGSSSQPPAICGVSDEVAQVSMMSGSPMNPPGLVALVLGVAGRARRSTGRSAADRLVGHERVVVAGSPCSSRGTRRDRHAEEALAADEPVAVEPLDPVVVAVLHVRRVPGDLGAAGDQRVAQVGSRPPLRMYHWREVTISSGVALLVELHRVLDRASVRRSAPGSASCSTMAFCACLTVSPAISWRRPRGRRPSGRRRGGGRRAR